MTDLANTYKSPLHLPGGHLQTIVHGLTRKVHLSRPYARERIDTPDGDFLDLDWLKQGSEKLVILCHGLEGSSDRPYIMGMAEHFFNHQFDVLSVNYRGCSGEINRAVRMYHSGATDDFSLIADHVAKDYDELYLIGFSLGGNMILKYLGEQGDQTKFKRAVAFSVPLDLHDGVRQLDQGFNLVYVNRFLKTLKQKVRMKSKQHPDKIDLTALDEIKTVFDLDDSYTSWIHGFHGAADYYYKNSSIRFIDHIKTPTWVINAANDPMIGKIATSKQPFKNTSYVKFLRPLEGGHVGFYGYRNKILWSEKTALSIVMDEI